MHAAGGGWCACRRTRPRSTSPLGKVADGGIVELAAGTYASPPNGFAIRNAGKGFTVRAAAGAAVTLDGGGSRTMLRFLNSNRTRGKRVTFERLTFRGGFNDNANEGGAVTAGEGRGALPPGSFVDNRATGLPAAAPSR